MDIVSKIKKSYKKIILWTLIYLGKIIFLAWITYYSQYLYIIFFLLLSAVKLSFLAPIAFVIYFVFSVCFIRLGTKCFEEIINPPRHIVLTLLKQVALSLPVMLISIALVMSFDDFRDYLDDRTRNKEIEKAGIYYDAADEFVDLESPGSDRMRNRYILGTPFLTSTAMIDYDEMRVAFVISDANEKYESCSTYELAKDKNDFSHLKIQFQRELSAPGKWFRTYYSPQGYDYHTAGVEIELENGELWRAFMSSEYLHIDKQYSYINSAVDNCDEIIAYTGDELPYNGLGIEHGSIFLNYDEMKGYVLYAEGSNCCCDVIFFDKIDRNDSYLSSVCYRTKHELTSPWDSLYTFDLYEDDALGGQGILIVSENGEIYVSNPRRIYELKATKNPYSGTFDDILESIGAA